MPRRPSGQSTSIYWLIDQHGAPFYCGKTVFPIGVRLNQHRYTARRYPQRALSRRVRASGDAIRIHVVEVVPLHGDWAARERRWIELLRANFADVLNIQSGGQGSPGMIHSDETKTLLSRKLRGQKRTAAQRKRIGKGRRGARHTIDTRELLSQKLRGKKRTPAQRARIAAAVKRRHAADRDRAFIKRRVRHNIELSTTVASAGSVRRSPTAAGLARIARAGLRRYHSEGITL